MKTNLLLIFFSFLLSACGNSPDDVAKQYWQGLINGDQEVVEQVSSAKSRGELQRAIAPNENSRVRFGETTVEEDRAQVETFLIWLDDDRKATEFELFTALVKEEGVWKIDTARTRQQFFTAVYRSSLDGLSAALAENLAAFQVLGEEVAGTMADDLSNAIDELQQQSSEANQDVQAFLESLDEDLREVIESVNQDP